MSIQLRTSVKTLLGLITVLFLLTIFESCGSRSSSDEQDAGKLLSLPVFLVDTGTALTVRDYLGTIEGKVNVEIRPQVEGILEKIYVDEGAYVRQGQNLFKINELPYREALKNAVAEETVEKAKQKNAQLEVESLKPLVDNDVISDVQLRTAQANFEVAKAQVAQAATAVATAKINLGFTDIKAPSSGYIGRIPKRIGNLVTKGDSQPLTILSDTREVYVYFSMSESDFLHFTKGGRSRDSLDMEHSNKLIPYVRLMLADGTEYAEKGVVDAIEGQVNRTTGAISLRASFPNPDDVLRQGNTGTLKMEERKPGVLLVPQVAAIELQDKTFVYIVTPDNKVRMRAVILDGVSGSNYIVKEGLTPGDRVVLAGFDRLEEGLAINPQVQNPKKD
ncbi:efflux RND transporter periplasmic adaptor subunit [Olivibacter sp. SDN3]|uniref:efflux RND transporter periplasmic adaptor subunit n=1 Tax=Olivibacter sp. SDN3 TaxID=2764720 RepID=UPI001651143E|nr:efflux RND transporter periplasmic adaptor subunit [Olivibacter sp. SDN3]QNL50431.1 efflux RND transporter periplasmic adaptor subunit [Olivibacter sp. SDN3]